MTSTHIKSESQMCLPSNYSMLCVVGSFGLKEEGVMDVAGLCISCIELGHYFFIILLWSLYIRAVVYAILSSKHFVPPFNR